MSINYNKLFRLLDERNISTYYLRQNKIIGQQTYYNLKNGKGNLGTESLEKLCKLLNCQPGDLMEYVEDQEQPATVTHTLNERKCTMPLPQEQHYTIEDIYNLPDGQRAELIDGQIYYLASPSRTHQLISKELVVKIDSFIKSNKGKCEIYPAPFDVFLHGNESECYIPDISVICNPDIIQERGCFGAPDWIAEITCPSTSSHDYLLKSVKYQAAGVREYWIVNPAKKTITVYDFTDENFIPQLYTFADKIKVNIYDDLYIDFSELDI